MVSHLPPEVAKDDLELLFESQRFCPDGGSVENVDVDAQAGTAVVTLEEEHGKLLRRIKMDVLKLDVSCTVRSKQQHLKLV